jgi:ribonuclease III
MTLPDYSILEQKINTKFNDKNLLKQAFTHRSYINENKHTTQEHNERLEFLGDAVLELIATSFLYKKYPKKHEGELTSFRAALVNTNTLSEVASKLGFNDFLLLSKGESKDTGRARQYILADTFEAVIGAIYIDQGYDVADTFITENLLSLTEEIVKTGSWIDAKSFFQEKSQEMLSVTPLYETILEEGPDHNKYFTVAVKIKEETIATGKGKSKQEAEQDAAQNALTKKGWLPV